MLCVTFFCRIVRPAYHDSQTFSFETRPLLALFNLNHIHTNDEGFVRGFR